MKVNFTQEEITQKLQNKGFGCYGKAYQLARELQNLDQEQVEITIKIMREIKSGKTVNGRTHKI